MICYLCLWLPVVLFVLLRVVLYINSRLRPNRVIGFFHPYCDSGGGGERVLWICVQYLLQNTKLDLVIFTGDSATGEEILQHVQTNFGVDVRALSANNRLRFVKLKSRALVEPSNYPKFTLLGQSVGSMILGLEALCKFVPDIWFDTTGFAFTYPAARLLGCRVACYVHYPTISESMFAVVAERKAAFNNQAISLSSSKAKLLYYWLFWCLYTIMGKCSQVAMANSRWTIARLRHWGFVSLVYPPCDTQALQKISLESKRELLLISVGQFRPEKNHSLQLQSFKICLERLKEARAPLPTLAIIGGARDQGDRDRVAALKAEADTLGIQENVKFCVSIPGEEKRNYFNRALVGLHSMTDEHFGISVVEFMAAGIIPVANDSGGPKIDIVVPHNGQATGYLATTAEQYADAMCTILKQARPLQAGGQTVELSPELQRMRIAAREQAAMFSDDAFNAGVMKALAPLL